MLDIRITTGSRIPIFRQVIDQVRRAVAGGELAVGDQLPSVRALAERLVVNHNTIAKAYAELSRDGVIESQRGRGVFVARRRNVFTKAERTRRLSAALDAFLSEALTLDFTEQEIRDAVGTRIAQMNGSSTKQ